MWGRWYVNNIFEDTDACVAIVCFQSEGDVPHPFYLYSVPTKSFNSSATGAHVCHHLDTVNNKSACRDVYGIHLTVLVQDNTPWFLSNGQRRILDVWMYDGMMSTWSFVLIGGTLIEYCLDIFLLTNVI